MESKYIFIGSIQKFRQSDTIYKLARVVDGIEFEPNLKYSPKIVNIDRKTVLRNIDLIYNLENVNGQVKVTGRDILDYTYDKDGRQYARKLVVLYKLMNIDSEDEQLGYVLYDKYRSSLTIIKTESVASKNVRFVLANATVDIVGWEPDIILDHPIPTMYIDYTTFLNELSTFSTRCVIECAQYEVEFSNTDGMYRIRYSDTATLSDVDEKLVIPEKLYGVDTLVMASVFLRQQNIPVTRTVYNKRVRQMLNEKILDDIDVIEVNNTSLDKILKKLKLLGNFKKHIIIVDD